MLVLFACHKHEDLNVFTFIAVCHSVEACFRILRSVYTDFNTNQVFIGNRDDCQNEKFLIQEVPINHIPN